MNWFMHHPVLLGLVGAAVAVAYGLYLTWWLLQQSAGQRADAGDLRGRAGRRRGLSQEAVHDDRDRRGRAVHPARRLPQARLGARVRVPRRRDPLGGRRVHRDERGRALERPDRGGGARRPEAGARRRLQGGLGDRAARRRPRPVRRHRLLLVPDRRAAQLADLGDQRPDRPRVRRLADLGLRASRRRHLHEGRRRRRRPRRQDRGRASPRTTRATRQ